MKITWCGTYCKTAVKKAMSAWVVLVDVWIFIVTTPSYCGFLCLLRYNYKWLIIRACEKQTILSICTTYSKHRFANIEHRHETLSYIDAPLIKKYTCQELKFHLRSDREVYLTPSTHLYQFEVVQKLGLTKHNLKDIPNLYLVKGHCSDFLNTDRVILMNLSVTVINRKLVLPKLSSVIDTSSNLWQINHSEDCHFLWVMFVIILAIGNIDL